MRLPSRQTGEGVDEQGGEWAHCHLALQLSQHDSTAVLKALPRLHKGRKILMTMTMTMTMRTPPAFPPRSRHWNRLHVRWRWRTGWICLDNKP